MKANANIWNNVFGKQVRLKAEHKVPAVFGFEKLRNKFCIENETESLRRILEIFETKDW